ncbi:MAG: hypothetical protein HYS27_19875 [Deltaproteobacteria bacterium]|nr:hypothetical protein [Deltaproteobacteria bacterium]
MSRHRTLGRARVGVALGLLPLGACFCDFVATPPPEAEIVGSVTDVPDELRARAGGAALRAQAVSVDGAVLAEVDTSIGAQFRLKLGPGQSHVNVRVVVAAGSVLFKDFVSEAAAGSVVDLDATHGPMGTASTAAAQVVERYAARERASLSSTPPTTLEAVLALARGDDERVVAFRGLVGALLAVADPQADAPALDATSSAAAEDALGLAGIAPAEYDAALEAAVDASLVPIVCDPSQLLVMFAVDVSGQAKDGNGAPQFIRQQPKEGRVFLGITLDPLSPVPDSAGALRPRLTPNDPATEMKDDGTGGDEAAGDQVFTTTLALPRGIRVLYKYTDGSPNEGFTGTEEWPGNARILQVDDVLTAAASGQPDCLLVRRDSFGDESSNKNYVNLHARLGGGDLGYDDDLGGAVPSAPPEESLLLVGGLALGDLASAAPLTPAGVPEARENGVCTACPAPLTVSADDDEAPRLVSAAFLATEETRVTFSEDVDVQSAGLAGNYLLVDAENRPVQVRGARVVGSEVVLSHEQVDPRSPHTVAVKNVRDASLQQNPIELGAQLPVGPDRTPPTIVSVRPGSIVDVNPATRPADPETGEVVILEFSEGLDRIAAENAANYRVADLDVHAAFVRGKEVLVVTSQQAKGAPYEIEVGTVFDVAGNVARQDGPLPFNGLSLSLVTFQAVVDFAWRSVDGSERGLPAGDGLFLTGTVLLEARAEDGGDLRAHGRTDVAGLTGFELLPNGQEQDGAPVYALTLRLPPGTYAYKLAHGDAALANNPPATLETVSKGLATRNDVGGVAVDPVTLQGRDGLSYAGARLSLNGQDLPGPGVLYKRENPDTILIIGEGDRTLPPDVIGTWRDVPFGSGADYDDGLVELPLVQGGVEDTEPPRLLGARARDSESVLVSFDEAVVAQANPMVRVTGEDGADLAIVETMVAVPLPNQLVVRTGAMANDAPYSLLIGGLADLGGHVQAQPVTAGFSSPAQFQPFTPIVDEEPPALVSVRPTSPTEIEVTFNERLTDDAAAPAHFAIARVGGGAAPTVSSARMGAGGVKVVLTTSAQGLQEPYLLTVSGVSDVAGNVLDSAQLAFPGFGELEPPVIDRVVSLGPTKVALLWNEALTADSASRLTNYSVSEVSVTAVRFGASDELRGAAFNTTYAPLAADIVVLTTTPMTGGGSYTVSAQGVTDLSGNESAEVETFTAAASAPLVDVLLTYQISDTAGVIGVGPGGSAGVPARALSPATLSAQREGVFVLGTALSDSGASPIADHPFTLALTGFPEEGASLTGVEPELLDNGTGGDAVAGDHVFSRLIPDVPLGSTLSWKAFAPFTTTFAQQNPSYPGAAFADAPRGPSVFGDGQEYPGNDNAVLLVADIDGDGRIVIDNLFGDEITFKRKTGFPAFHLAVDRARRSE